MKNNFCKETRMLLLLKIFSVSFLSLSLIILLTNLVWNYFTRNENLEVVLHL